MSRINTVNGGFAGYTSVTSTSKDEPEYSFSTMLFQQAAAPVGWVKETNASMDNSALSITNKTSGLFKPTGTGSPFSSVFSPITSVSTSYPISVSLGATTVTTAMLPAHTHVMGGRSNPPGAATYFANFKQPNSPPTPSVFAPSYSNASPISGTSVSTGIASGSSGHSHTASSVSIPVTIPDIDFSLKYVDAIMATRY